MSKGFYKIPKAVNEPVKDYKPNSPELNELMAVYQKYNQEQWDIPMYIGSKEVRTGNIETIHPPHDHQKTIGQFHLASVADVKESIEVALEARKKWSKMSWENRASIFMKAADLLAGPYRAKMNAATMLCQSKNVFQAEIDAACELVDFFKFNVQYMGEIYENQPISSPGTWNRLDYRPLEGFVYAVTPFNFTSIAANLPASAVMMGNVCVWKPSNYQVYSAKIIVDLFKEAGLPDGVINVVYGDPVMITNEVLSHPEFSGIHFTGSTTVFKSIWEQIGKNLTNYKTYPRIVGETGGKDFIWAHPSANAKQVATAITRGAFEYQGQKCSAASRAYIPKSMWAAVSDYVKADLASIKMGAPDNTDNFVNAVIHEGSFDKITSYIDRAKNASDANIIAGGGYDKSVGYFIEPTVIETTNPKYETMCTELFGPVMTVFVYEDDNWEESLELVDQTSQYALTGAIFSNDRYVVDLATDALENAAGNFYINDKPTGAVVGQQPFGGARASGTNDKAGSVWNLLRWVSARNIKENFLSPADYRYPFLTNSK